MTALVQPPRRDHPEPSECGAKHRAGQYTVHNIVGASQHPMLLRMAPTPHTAHPPLQPRDPSRMNFPALLADEAQLRLLLHEKEMKGRMAVCRSVGGAMVDTSEGMMNSCVARAAEATVELWSSHVTFLEIVRRDFLQQQDEPEARHLLAEQFARESMARSAGLAPMKRFLHKYLLRQRACNAIRDKKLIDISCAEIEERSTITNTAAEWFSTRVLQFLLLLEDTGRRQIINSALLFFYGVARIQLKIMEQIDLFEIKFACPLASAPKMCGRVARHSLFHALALHEAHGRTHVVRQHERVCIGYEAWTSLLRVVDRDEPSHRQLITERWAAEYDTIRRQKRQVVAYYTRRELEHEEHGARATVAKEEGQAFARLCANAK